MKLKAGETFYVVFDPKDVWSMPILTKKLEGEWQKVDGQKEKSGCSCHFFCYLDNNYCTGCGAPI